MKKGDNKIVKSFSSRKVSTDQATKSLRDNGIHVNEEEAIIILDFLYLLASSFKKGDAADVLHE